MPKPSFPPDRFDDLPAEGGRVGAHRAENPRMRPLGILLWAGVATVVLAVAGIFGALVMSGRIALFPDEPVATATPTPTITPVVDTAYSVLVLNATPETGAATQMKDTIVAAGWSSDDVFASEAGSTDFATTTIFYVDDADEAAAAGLAEVIGGAAIAQSDAYQMTDDPDTEADEGAQQQLTVVIGLDSTAQE